MNYSAKCTIKKHGRVWYVTVPADVVTTVSFIAPFRDYDKALRYVRYLLEHYRVRPGRLTLDLSRI